MDVLRAERAAALAACATGVALVVLGGTALWPSAAADVGYVPDAPAEAAAPPAPAPPPAPAATRAPTSVPVPVAEAEGQGVRMAAAEPARRTPDPAPPVRLELPRLGLSAPVVPVAVDPDGALGVPTNPDVLGWWVSGARPGDGRGSVVIDGHVDSATEGLGVFARLRELDVGDPVLTQSALGVVQRYRVTGRRQFAKAALPADAVFAQDVQERLVLITCGGQFDRDVGRYADNVVVFAELVADPGRPS